MKIADKILDGQVEPSVEEVKYLLWMTLCELSYHTSNTLVLTDPDESFNIDKMLDVLSVQPAAEGLK
tara:strand:- start:1802 stop:2002 length:201 start_codon:yes stop_codon:yes gene_type:complete